MAKESNHRITPENAEAQIKVFLKGARVGSMEFIAFWNVLYSRTSVNELDEIRRLKEITDSGDAIPETYRDFYTNQSKIDSALREAESNHVLAEHEAWKYESWIPGYARATSYAEDLISKYEKYMIQTSNADLGDPALTKIRRVNEAHNTIHDFMSVVIMSDRRAIGQSLVGLIRNLISKR